MTEYAAGTLLAVRRLHERILEKCPEKITPLPVFRSREMGVLHRLDVPAVHRTIMIGGIRMRRKTPTNSILIRQLQSWCSNFVFVFSDREPSPTGHLGGKCPPPGSRGLSPLMIERTWPAGRGTRSVYRCNIRGSFVLSNRSCQCAATGHATKSLACVRARTGASWPRLQVRDKALQF